MNIGSKKQLLVDDFIIEEKNRWVRRVINQPQRHSSKPIMVGEKPWENWVIVLFGTVLYDEEEKIYKMWYTSGLAKYPVRPFQIAMLPQKMESPGKNQNWVLLIIMDQVKIIIFFRVR